MLNSEVPYVRCLDRSDREDVRLHQPHCHNASAYGLRGYVDNTLPSRCYVITMILRVRRNFFEMTAFPNRGVITSHIRNRCGLGHDNEVVAKALDGVCKSRLVGSVP